MKDLLEQLQALAPLAAAATAGPWRVSPHPDGGPSRVVDMGRRRSPKAPFCVCHGDGAPQLENAAFIAAARNLLTEANLQALCAALAPQWREAKAGLTTPCCLPEIDEKVLLYRASGNIAVGQLTWAYRWLLKDGTVLLLQSITHWMPLPQAPVTMEGARTND